MSVARTPYQTEIQGIPLALWLIDFRLRLWRSLSVKMKFDYYNHVL